MSISSHAQPIDRVLYNARIVTQDEAQPRAQALAITGGRIAATGSNETIRALAGPQTHSLDIGGRTVIPGLIDSHIHAIRAGLAYTTEASWIGVADLASALQRITEAAHNTDPSQIVVIAGGWNVQQFREARRPTLQEIEQSAPGRAVYIQLAYNSVLMTSQALQHLGIAGQNNLPEGAKFETDSQDRRSGWITGPVPAIVALFDRLPKNDVTKNIEGTRAFFARLNAYGVTGVIDPGGHNLRPAEYAALFDMAQRDQLTLRVAFSAFAPRRGLEREDLERLARDYAQHKHPLLQFNGIGENVTWGMYNNDAPSDEDIGAFEDVALWAAAQKLRLTLHWNNDASVHHALDVLQRVNMRHPLKDLRWSIAHLHDGSRETIARMHGLGLGWLVQNAGYFASPAWLRARGSRLAITPPLRSALQMGIPVGGGTDAHRVMNFNPFLSLRWMIDGVTVAGVVTRGEAELLTREEALRIYTAGSAWFTGDEGRRGKLQAGYDADLAVLDGDYLTAPLGEFARMSSLLTLVGGRIVHAAGPFAAEKPVLPLRPDRP